jgi:hypothetical protein
VDFEGVKLVFAFPQLAYSARFRELDCTTEISKHKTPKRTA